MASGKLSPRQKMINMMYLVLVALLALNISKDILEALTKLDNSLAETVQTVDKKNADIYAAFAAAAADNPTKAGPWRDKAMDVKKQSDILFDQIATMKDTLIAMTGGEEDGEPLGLDNKEKPANYLLNKKHATDLKKEIDDYRSFLVKQADGNPQLQASLKQVFNTDDKVVGEDGAKASWESATFEHFPLAAILPFLTDLQAKIRNSESDVISNLQRNIGKTDLKFTGVKAVVMPKSTYVTQGDQYEAEVFVAAYDETQEPQITIEGNPLPQDQIENGVGKVKFKANSVGQHKWAGMITIKQIGQDPLEVPVSGSYTVAPPTAVISPTKMNVLYRGVDNPLEISVPGVDPANIIVSAPGIHGSNGQYMADVSNVKGTELNISVSVKDGEGTRSIGSKKFRLKGLPPASGYVFGKSEGIMSKSLLQRGEVTAAYEDFPFDLKLTVTGFEIAIPGFPPEKVNGSKMTESVKTRIDRLKPGSTVSIRDIRAITPKGTRVPKIGNISIDVN